MTVKAIPSSGGVEAAIRDEPRTATDPNEVRVGPPRAPPAQGRDRERLIAATEATPPPTVTTTARRLISATDLTPQVSDGP